MEDGKKKDKKKKKGRNNTTKMNEAPSPKLLGTGMAREAGEKLKGRKASLDARIKAAGG